MSYDLMVFDKKFAPAHEQDFAEWYKVQTEWSENHNYFDPIVTSPDLKKWFFEMIETFPSMNGPSAKEGVNDKDSKVTDYCIGGHIIYACFAWEEAEKAFNKMTTLAEKFHLGLLDVNSNDFRILFDPCKEKLTFDNENATNERFEQDMKKYKKIVPRVGLTNEGIGGWTIADFVGFDENNKMTVLNVKLGHAVESYFQRKLKESMRID